MHMRYSSALDSADLVLPVYLDWRRQDSQRTTARQTPPANCRRCPACAWAARPTAAAPPQRPAG
eukprot:11186717-Lingulodinium_polyedra.AAC.1